MCKNVLADVWLKDSEYTGDDLNGMDCCFESLDGADHLLGESLAFLNNGSVSCSSCMMNAGIVDEI
jgi:hypothetical protein